MAILIKGTDFSTGNQVSASALDALVDNATFDTGAVDNSTTQLSSGAIIVKDGGVTASKLASDSVTADKIASGSVTSAKLDTNIAIAGTLSVVGAITATAGQVVFPSTQNASSNANTLDDYEEGTWTPSLGGNASYTSQTGYYTKIGRLVTAHCSIVVDSLGTGSQYAITGLPFSAAFTSSGSVGYWTGAASTLAFVGCYANGTTITLTGYQGTATLTNTPAFFTNGTLIHLMVSYSV